MPPRPQLYMPPPPPFPIPGIPPLMYPPPPPPIGRMPIPPPPPPPNVSRVVRPVPTPTPPLTPEERELSVILEDKVTTVWVGKICPGVGDEAIKRLLEACGDVVNWRRLSDASGQPKGFGFCDFKNAHGALCALAVLNNLLLGDRQLQLKVDEKTQKYLEKYAAARKQWRRLQYQKQLQEKKVKETEQQVDEKSKETLVTGENSISSPPPQIQQPHQSEQLQQQQPPAPPIVDENTSTIIGSASSPILTANLPSATSQSEQNKIETSEAPKSQETVDREKVQTSPSSGVSKDEPKDFDEEERNELETLKKKILQIVEEYYKKYNIDPEEVKKRVEKELERGGQTSSNQSSESEQSAAKFPFTFLLKLELLFVLFTNQMNDCTLC
jgi:hypothetical protein